MYIFYLGSLLFPVAPEGVNIKANNQNKTLTLINEGEINLLKSRGLQEISFEVLIPHQKYSFSKYLGGVLPIQHYTEALAAMKATKKPIQFIILRNLKSISGIYNTNIKVSVEDYSLIDSADKYGEDIGISIKLKEYKDKSNILMSIVGKVENKTQYLLTKVRESAKILPKTYTANPGDTLFTIAKKQLGDGSKAQNLLELNKLPNLIDIVAGQVIRLE